MRTIILGDGPMGRTLAQASADAGEPVGRVLGRPGPDGHPAHELADADVIFDRALTGQEHRVRLLGGQESGRLEPVTVAGPLCSGLDVFSHHAVMREPRTGDLVAVLDAGAYGFSEAMPAFLTHGTPPEVAVKAGRAETIRPRIPATVWLDQQRQPNW